MKNITQLLFIAILMVSSCKKKENENPTPAVCNCSTVPVLGQVDNFIGIINLVECENKHCYSITGDSASYNICSDSTLSYLIKKNGIKHQMRVKYSGFVKAICFSESGDPYPNISISKLNPY